MTLTIPTKYDATAPCEAGAIAARMQLAGAPANLWFAAFHPKQGCSAVRGYEVGPYANSDGYSAAQKAQDVMSDLTVIERETPNGAGVFFSGPNRSGKSHLAAAQVRLLAGKQDCFWINELDFVQFVNDSFDPAKTAPKVADLIHYITTPANVGWRVGRIARVIYDDAGAQFDYGSTGTRWIGELLAVINAVAAAGIAFTLTSNLGDGALVEPPEKGGFGPRLGERLLEMAGAPVVLFPRATSVRAARPAPRARCTCLDHETASVPTPKPPAYINIPDMLGNDRLYVPPQWTHFYGDTAGAPQELNSKNVIPDHFTPISAEKRAELFANIAAISRRLRTKDDPYADDEAYAKDRAGDGLYCHKSGAACDADPGHTDPNFPGWSAVHAAKWHKAYPPQIVEEAASHEQEQAS